MGNQYSANKVPEKLIFIYPADSHTFKHVPFPFSPDHHTRKTAPTYAQHHFPPIDVFLQWEQKWQPLTLNITACTCGEGLGRSENSRGLALAPAEQRGHKPLRVVAAAAARHFLDVLHVPWKNTSLSASNVKSTALYQSTKECEWRIKITKLTGIPENEWKSNKIGTWESTICKMFSILKAGHMMTTVET